MRYLQVIIKKKTIRIVREYAKKNETNKINLCNFKLMFSKKKTQNIDRRTK